MENNKFNKDSKLYVNFEVSKHPEEFLHYFLTFKRNNIYCTGRETYIDKDCKIIHTTLGRMRSFDDIYIVTRTYFPDITIKEVINIILRLYTGDNYFPQLSNCSGMMKIRFIYRNTNSINQYNNVNHFNSVYSWNELINMLGKKNIYNEETLTKYIVNNRIIIGKKETYIYKRDEEVYEDIIVSETKIKKVPKTINNLKITFGRNNVTIGSTILQKTDVKGMLKRFEPIIDNKFKIKGGAIVIEDKNFTAKQLEIIYNNIIN